MAKAESEKKLLPPYVPYKTFGNFIDNLSAVGIPQRIDRSVMKSMSGGLQGQLMLSLEYLGLITDNGTPTEILERFVNSEGAKRQETLHTILVASYGFIFQDGLQLERATASQFRERFEQTGATGDTLRKCMAYFLNAAKAADINLSSYIQKVPSPRTIKKVLVKLPKPKTPIQESPPSENRKEDRNMPPVQKEDIALEKMILAKMPDFNPEWSEEAQQSWLETINKLMDRFQNRG